MSDHWESYLCRVNDQAASVFVDLGIGSQAPGKSRPYLLWIWVEMLKPRPDGLSSREEAEILWKLEDSLVSPVCTKLSAVFVGRITNAGRREFYFYVPKAPEDASAITEALTTLPTYSFDWGSKDDAAWTQYFSVLYPSPEEFQQINNRKVLDTLREHGDSLQEPREVRHWIYFNTAEDRDRFILEIGNLRYEIENESEDPKKDHPFGVCVKRDDFVDSNSIDAAVVELFRLAEESRGFYDGWETEVVRVTN